MTKQNLLSRGERYRTLKTAMSECLMMYNAGREQMVFEFFNTGIYEEAKAQIESVTKDFPYAWQKKILNKFEEFASLFKGAEVKTEKSEVPFAV